MSPEYGDSLDFRTYGLRQCALLSCRLVDVKCLYMRARRPSCPLFFRRGDQIIGIAAQQRRDRSFFIGRDDDCDSVSGRDNLLGTGVLEQDRLTERHWRNCMGRVSYGDSRNVGSPAAPSRGFYD